MSSTPGPLRRQSLRPATRQRCRQSRQPGPDESRKAIPRRPSSYRKGEMIAAQTEVKGSVATLPSNALTVR